MRSARIEETNCEKRFVPFKGLECLSYTFNKFATTAVMVVFGFSAVKQGAYAGYRNSQHGAYY